MTDITTFSERLGAYVDAAAGKVNRGFGQRIDAFVLAKGRAIGWRAPASCDPNLGSCESHRAARAVAIANGAAGEAARIARDPDLSETKKAADGRAVMQKAEAELAKLHEAVAGDLVQFAARERATLAPERLTGDELARAEAHVSRFLQIDRDAQMALIAEMRNGNHPAILAALADTEWPLPTGIAESVRLAWSEHVQRTQPELVQQLACRRERLEWLAAVVEQAAGAVHVQSTAEERLAAMQGVQAA